MYTFFISFELAPWSNCCKQLATWVRQSTLVLRIARQLTIPKIKSDVVRNPSDSASFSENSRVLKILIAELFLSKFYWLHIDFLKFDKTSSYFKYFAGLLSFSSFWIAILKSVKSVLANGVLLMKFFNASVLPRATIS